MDDDFPPPPEFDEQEMAAFLRRIQRRMGFDADPHPDDPHDHPDKEESPK